MFVSCSSLTCMSQLIHFIMSTCAGHRNPLKTHHAIMHGVYLGNYEYHRGPGSVVGIAIVYGLDGPGIESRWGEIFRTSPNRP